MATIVKPGLTTRNRNRGSNHGRAPDGNREQQLDLLTAALLGAAVGAGITLLLRTGPSGRRPIGPVLRTALRGAELGGAQGRAPVTALSPFGIEAVTRKAVRCGRLCQWS